jgi:hypothetical protein
MQRLNGHAGIYNANEGIAITSISEALLKERTIALELDMGDP